MASRVDGLELPTFDYTDPSMRGDRFHAAMREVRETGWLAKAPFGYMVLDRESAEFFLRTRSAIFPGMKIAEIFGVTQGPLYEEMRRNILHVNGADHSRLRSLVNPALSPRAVERYRPVMRGFLEGLLEDAASASASGADGADGADGGGQEGAAGGATVACEFVEAFAKPYPSQVIATVMGAPPQDAPRLHHWSNWIQRQFDAASMASEIGAIEQAVQEFYDYAEALVTSRRSDPGDDLISKLIEAADPAHPPTASPTSSASTSSSTCSSVASTRRRAISRTRSGCSPNTRRSGSCSPRTPVSPRPPSRRRCASSR
jgi:cytochrome P450